MRSRLLTVLLAGLFLTTSAEGQDKEKVRKDAFGDDLPENVLTRLGSGRFRAETTISAAAFHPDGKTIWTGGTSNRLTVWDVQNGKILRTIQVGSSSVSNLQFSADGNTLVVSGSYDGSARILESTNGEEYSERRSLQDPQKPYSHVAAVLSPDAKTLLMIHRNDRQLTVWDVEKSAVKHRVQNLASSAVSAFAFTPDGKQFTALWTDNRLHLVDVESGKSVRTLEPNVASGVPNPYGSRIASLAITHDGKHALYRATVDRHFKMVELATAKEVKKIEAAPPGTSFYSGNSGTMTITPNGRFFMEASGNPGVRIWGLASGRQLRDLTSPSGNAYQMAMSRDGKQVVSWSGNNLYLWDVGLGKLLNPGTGHNYPISRVALNADGKRVLTADSTTMRIWDADSGKELYQTRVFGNVITHLALSRDGKTARWLNSSDRAVYEWKFDAGESTPVKITNPRPTTHSYSYQMTSPDGKLLAGITTNDRKLRIFDLVGTTKERELTTVVNAYGNQLAFSPDSKYLATSNQTDRSVTIYEVATGAETWKLLPDMSAPPTFYGMPTVVFARDNRQLLKYDGEVRLIEVLTNGERARLPRDIGLGGTQFAWSKDGRLVARHVGDGVVSVYDTVSGQELLRRPGGQGNIQCLAFSADGRRLVTGGANTTALVWDLPVPSRLAGSAGSDVQDAWKELDSLNAAKAFRAMAQLQGAPDETVKLLKARLQVQPITDERAIDKLIHDLDDDEFQVRRRASELLAELGTKAEAALQDTLRKTRSLEVRKACRELLGQLGAGSTIAPERLRVYRAVEVLEKIGNADAREMLKGMLKGPMDKSLKASVEAALERLEE